MKTILNLNALAVLGFFLVSSPVALSKGYSPALTAQPGGYAVKFASNGTPLAVPVTGGLAARIESPIKFAWPNGVDAAGAAVSIFTGARTAGAWGAASAALGIASLYAIPPIKNWMETVALAPTVDGLVGIKPAGADLFDYTTDGGNSYQSTALKSCILQDSRVNTSSSGPWYKRISTSYRFTSGSAGFCVGDIVLQNHSDTTSNHYGVDLYGTGRRDKIIPVEPEPISMSAAVSLLSLAAPSAAIVQALVDLNFPPEPEKPIITGKLSEFKGNTVSLGLDGTVTEIEERYIASFQPGIIGIGVEKKQTVTTPSKTSSTVTTNPDGSTTTAVTTSPGVSSTISTTSPVTPEDNAIDTALPSLPKLYTPVYPLGFAGVWQAAKGGLKSAPLTALASSLMPNVASSGACPAMPVDLTFASWASFGVRDVAPPCYVWDWGKAFVILGALLLARALIFGG